jgi:hypothetical protein
MLPWCLFALAYGQRRLPLFFLELWCACICTSSICLQQRSSCSCNSGVCLQSCSSGSILAAGIGGMLAAVLRWQYHCTGRYACSRVWLG